MKRPPFKKLLLFLSLLLLCGAAGGETARVLLGLTVVLLAAKLGGDLAVRARQPEVLGELGVGLLLGNIGHLSGITTFDFLVDDPILHILSELGVILLLFQVGLETNLKEMGKVGSSALLVAILGVVAPAVLGGVTSWGFHSEASVLVHAFVGATLAATSVGITASVLRELGKVRTSEGKIILGAAVVDDVLGLVVLSVVAGAIGAAEAGESLDYMAVLRIISLAVIFLGGSVALGSYFSPSLFRYATALKSRDLLLVFSLMICFGLSYLAALAGLAPIVGAFTAGLILEPVHYRELSERAGRKEVDELVHPIASLLLPVFFIRMGATVDLRVFAQTDILLFALVLTLAAVVGKQLCGLGVLDKATDRIAVGIGMIPRGEVGLIFASVGAGLMLHGKPVIDKGIFGAVLIMVIVTTMITPPLIKWRFQQLSRRAGEGRESSYMTPPA